MIRGAGRPVSYGHRADGTSALSVNALAQNSTLAASRTTVQSGKTILLTLTAKDASGQGVGVGGETVTFTAQSPDGIVSELNVGASTDVGNGTYTSIVTGSLAKLSPNTLSATIAGGTVQTTMPAIRVWDVPGVASITPAQGGVDGGSLHTISGTSFDTATTFKLGANSVSSVTIVNQTTAIGYAPSGSAGSVNVVAATFGSNGTLTNGFTYYDALFEADWSTATGTSNNALGDGGKFPTIDNGQGKLEVIPATGLNFPAGMANVLRVQTQNTGTQGSDSVSGTDLWPLPGVGESLYYRLYLRNDISDSAGDKTGTLNSHHPVESNTGSVQWEWQFVSDDNGTFPYRFYVLSVGQLVLGWPETYLSKGSTYRFEWQFTRSGTSQYSFPDFRIYDEDNVLRWDKNTIKVGATGPLLKDSTSVWTMNDDYMRDIIIGTNGGAWTFTTTEPWYYGGFKVSATTWCGAY